MKKEKEMKKFMRILKIISLLNNCYFGDFEKPFEYKYFNYKKYSWILPYVFNNDFIEIWWNMQLFNEKDYNVLIVYCHKSFDVWWNEDFKINNCFNLLLKYCFKKIDIWYLPEKLNNKENSKFLFQYTNIITSKLKHNYH